MIRHQSHVPTTQPFLLVDRILQNITYVDLFDDVPIQEVLDIIYQEVTPKVLRYRRLSFYETLYSSGCFRN